MKKHLKQITTLAIMLILSLTLQAQWTQIGTDIDGEAAGDLSGRSVSLSANGSVVAIGADENLGNNTLAGGHVRIYEYILGTWTQLGNDIDGEAAGDYSGRSVSLSANGSVVAIGAMFNDGNGSNAGHVRVYENIAGTWTQIGADIDGETTNDWSGESVSISSDGNTLAIGARSNDGNGSSSGHVRIYNNVSGTWTQIGTDIDGEAADDQSGWSVSLSADASVVAIGSTRNSGNGLSAGHVRIYKNFAGTWIQIGTDIDGEAASNKSGHSVSLSDDGSVVAIGATDNDDNGIHAGHVRIYRDISGTWTQIGSDIDGEAAYDESGCSVSISSDGSVVAIGAQRNDGSSSNAGHTRIYKNIAGTWTQRGLDIDGEATVDYSGCSESLSSDGNTLAIGAIYNDGNGSNAGHVRVYTCNSYATINPIDCDTFLSPSGKIWTISGIYFDSIPNAMGCDSIITINLTINSNTGDTSAVTCDSMTWYGTTYYASAMPTHTFMNVAGCDSVVTLNLTINNNTGDTTAIVCDSMTWYGTTYYASVTPTHTLTNIAGCDSVITLNLTINNNTGDTTAVVCDSMAWYGITYYASAMPTHTLTNVAGCDSVVTLDLTVNYSNTGDTTAIVCDSMVWYGNTYYVSSMPTQTFINHAGCDSVVTLDLTINFSNTGDTTAIVCDSMVWYGNTYYVSAFPMHTFMNVAGCDSVVTLNLTINNNTGDTTAVVCDSMAWYGTTYYSSAMATYTLTNVAGCDSVVTLDLTVNYSNTGDTAAIVCDSMAWYGTTYYASAMPTQTFMNVAGCDSVVTLDLTINTVDVSVTSNNATLTANQTGADYQWIFCSSLMPIAGATNQSFSPIVNGYYAVIVDDGNCIDTSSCYTITGVGINNFNTTSISIYPNPTSEKITIQCENMQRVELLDITGKLVYDQAVSSNLLDLDISTYSKGVYFVKITTLDAIATELIVLE